jgi:glutamine amidotransferase
MQMIAIIDYDAGNIKSVEKAVKFLGFDCVTTRDKDVIDSADKLILPGVGAFGDAMEKLNSFGLVDVIKSNVEKNKPLLGICLGMQILFEEGDESPGVMGLGLLGGKIKRLPEKEGFKIPHMGWNQIKVIDDNPLLKGLDGKYVYFVHSYYCPKSKDASALTTYAGVEYVSVVRRGNVYATQFHPEKSGNVGLEILKNFGEL